jgi:hypothetical protein
MRTTTYTQESQSTKRNRLARLVILSINLRRPDSEVYQLARQLGTIGVNWLELRDDCDYRK